MRITLSTLGSLGDLHPFLGVGRALHARGHDVTVATSPMYAERVAHAGLEFHAIPPDIAPDDPRALDAVMDRWRGPERIHRELVFPHLRGAYESILPVVRESDLVLRSVLSYHASIAAESAGVPWMSLQLSPLCFFSNHEPPVLAPVPWLASVPLGPRVRGALMRFLFAITESWAKPVAELRKELGLPYRGNPFVEEQLSGALTVAAFSKHFYPAQPDWPRNVAQTGFVFHGEAAELDADLERFLDAGEPPVVFTLGSTAVHEPGPALARMVEAARATGRRCVVLVGDSRREEFAPLATELVWIGGYAPYAELFARSAVVVHQGGVGTTAQVMRAGCAHFVLPHCNDQPDNASRVVRLGIGQQLPARRATAQRLCATALSLLADAETRARAAQLGGLIRAENGAEAAADAILRLV